MANCGHYLDVLHAEPAVELNAFLRAPQDASTPPTHAAVRHLLPALWGSPLASPGAPHSSTAACVVGAAHLTHALAVQGELPVGSVNGAFAPGTVT